MLPACDFVCCRLPSLDTFCRLQTHTVREFALMAPARRGGQALGEAASGLPGQNPTWMKIWPAIWPGVTVVDATEPTATVTLVFGGSASTAV
jgi:hypothetical protein